MFLIRSSKFRHVYGSPAKKELCYEGIKITNTAHDGCLCAANPKFLALVTESAGGGVFLVLPLDQTGRIVANYAPKVTGHRGPVTDVKWNPFNDHIVASASEDTTIKTWKIPEKGLIGSLGEWEVELKGHSKKCSYIEWHPTAENILLSAGADFRRSRGMKCSYIEWHPTAENILLSAGADFQCMVWNAGTGEKITTISVHTDTIFSLSWNRTGSLFATTCKDKNIRVIDAISGSVVSQGMGHSGAKTSKVVFVDDDRLFTCGFSRMSERQYAIWDPKNLSKPLKLESVDASSGVLMPFYDHDTHVVYLAGKGDGNIRFYELVKDPPYVYFLSQYMSGNPQRGFGFMPKRGISTERCEIFRFYKLHSLKDLCEPLSMIVPRKSEQYQEDIYPPTMGTRPSVTAQEWLSGITREPYLFSLKDGKPAAASPIKEPVQTELKKTIKVYNPLREKSSVTEETKTSAQTNVTSSTSSSSSQRATENNGVTKLPASIMNIQRLSSSENQAENTKTNETRSTTAHNGAICSSPGETSRVDRRVSSSGYVSITDRNNSNIANQKNSDVEREIVHMKSLVRDSSLMSDTELRKAYHSQIEEIFGLKEQLMNKEKRIRQLEDEVKILRASQPNSRLSSTSSIN